MKLINFLFLVIIAYLFTGCYSEKSNVVVVKEKKYKYNEQDLIIPKELKDKLYYWTSVKNSKYVTKDLKFKGKNSKKQFSIKSTRPTYENIFLGNVEVLKLKIKLSTQIRSNNIVEKVVNTSIHETFKVVTNVLGVGINYPYSTYEIAVSTKKNRWFKHKITRKNYLNEDKSFVIDYPLGDGVDLRADKITTKVLTLRSGRKKSGYSTVEYDPDELYFYVKDLNIEKKIIMHNLENRKNVDLNEDLIRHIAINDPMLFRKLQYSKKRYSLSSLSLLKLPNDIKVSYGIKNFSKIISTGRYLTYKNKYKRFNVKKVYHSKNIDYKKVVKKLYVDKKSSSVKLKKYKNKDDSFIDFDKGI